MYLWIKLIHIISATLIFGTGLGTAFYMWRANQTNNLDAMLFAARNVVLADWIFTTSAIVVQVITGFLLIHVLHYSLTTKWILSSLALFIVVGICWLPVVWLQIKVRDMLIVAKEQQSPLPERYHHYMRIWFILGWPAFIGVLIIFYLMVFKPF